MLCGKTMENMRKRISRRLVGNEKDYLKWTSKLSYMSLKIIDNDLIAIHKSKVTLTFNKLAYIGVCILDLSKVLMYKFHYDYILRLSFNYTDSVTYEIKTKDAF